MKMKFRFPYLFFIFVLPLLFLPSRVFGASYIYNFRQEALNLINSSDFNFAISTIENNISSNNISLSNYILAFENSGTFTVLYFDSISLTSNSTNFKSSLTPTNSCLYSFSSDFSSLTLVNCNTSGYNLLYSYRWPIYSTTPLITSTDTGNTLTFNAGTYTFSTTDNIGNVLPTLSSLTGISPTPPTPPGPDLSILSSFYSLCIDKLSLLADSFSSNVIYISLFAISIFFTFSYLILRRFFK